MEDQTERKTEKTSGLACFGEEEYEARMRDTVEPALAEIRQSGRLAVKGGEVYYELFPLEGADTVVISHGFSESTEKFTEFIYYLRQAGYQAAVWDHRGHGRSLREGKDKNIVHVEDFEDYVEDMRRLMEERLKDFGAGTCTFLPIPWGAVSEPCIWKPTRKILKRRF